MPNGGFNTYGQRTTRKRVARPYPQVRTNTGRIARGQVLKAYTWLERLSNGELQAHSGLTFEREYSLTGTLAAGEFVTIGSVRVTATVAMTPTEVATAFITKSAGTKGTVLEATPVIAILTPGVAPTNVRASSVDFDTASALGVSSSAGMTVNTLSPPAVGAGTGGTSIATPGGGVVAASMLPIAGLLLIDVDAQAGAVDVPVIQSGSFWADGIQWRNTSADSVQDAATLNFITCSAYDTGCASDLAYQAFVNGTEFEIVTQLAGEVEV